jgi:ribosome-binding factor A
MADAGRARKIADRTKTLIAANVESIVKDPDLGFITITDVRVTGDLQHASVFYTVFGDEAQRAKTAAHLEDLLREAKERDEAVAAAAAGATYAGEADPYKKPEPGDEDDLDGATDGTDPGSTGTDSTDTDGTQDLGADARA